MTGKNEREISAEAEEEFERRAAADEPAGSSHDQPPRGRAQVYSVRIPLTPWPRCGGWPRRAGSFPAC